MSVEHEYRQRLEAREARVAHHEKIHIRLGNIRLGLFLAAAVVAWEAFHAHRLSVWWLAAPLAAFVAVAANHSRVLRARDLARRAVEFYRNGLWPDL